MNERLLLKTGGFAAVVVAGCAALVWGWDVRVAVGVFAGGAWNLASLWCLAQALNAWLGPQPSRRRALGWVMLKFPLLYLLVFGLLQTPAISVIGFGVGFTVVLMVGVAVVSLQRPPLASRAHGR